MERRQHIRIQVPVVIEFVHPLTKQPERSFTQDISEAGLRFPTTAELAVGQELALTLQLASPEARFYATGEVMWVREIARLGSAQYDVGVRFRWIEDPDRQRLFRYLEEFPSRRL